MDDNAAGPMVVHDFVADPQGGQQDIDWHCRAVEDVHHFSSGGTAVGPTE